MENQTVRTPTAYDAVVLQIPRGKVATKAEVAGRYTQDKEDSSMIMVGGAALGYGPGLAAQLVEAAKDGVERGIPWWRVVKRGGKLDKRFPGGVAAQATFLEQEGHGIAWRGKRAFVASFNEVSVTL